MTTKIRLICFATVSLFLICAPLIAAGPVNSAGSFPMAAMNGSGDYLIAGNQKALLAFGENFRGIDLESFDLENALFSGGISERDQVGVFAAFCAGSRIWRYRNDAQIDGWEFHQPDPAANWRCAVGHDGTFVRINSVTGQIWVNETRVDKISGGAGDIRLTRFGNGFAVVNVKGIVTTLSLAGRVTSTTALGLSFNEFWNAAGSGAGLLIADSEHLIGVQNRSDGALARYSVPVAPCGTSSICGLSLAEDGSWVITGFWGGYFGKGTQSNRIQLASLPVDRGGSAVAHNHFGGRFVYVGSDDGDAGDLPTFVTTSSVDRLDRTSYKQTRLFVWKKFFQFVDQETYLGTVSLGQGRDLFLFVTDQPERALSKQKLADGVVAIEEEFELPAIKEQVSIRATAPKDWWQNAIHLNGAKEILKKAGISPSIVKVALVDSGIDFNNKFRPERIWENPFEVAENKLDDDHNGFVDDWKGFDFTREDSHPEDEFGHGSHVAGLIAGKGLGAAENVELVVLKAIDKLGKSNTIDLARALLYAKSVGAEVVNCSWGGGGRSQGLQDAFKILTDGGLIVINSAGNDHADADKYPQVPLVFPGVIGIASAKYPGILADSSNFGEKNVKYLVPGAEMLSLDNGGDVRIMSGTSMAAGVASGSFAFLLGVAKKVGIADNIRKSTVQDVLCKTAVADNKRSTSCGLINLESAIQKLVDKSMKAD